MHRSLPAAAFGVVLATAACAASQRGGRTLHGARDSVPPAFALDSARLAFALDSTRDAMAIPGASAALIFPDGRTWAGTSGVAFDTVSVTPATVFQIGSITKTFTAALTVQLAGEGILSLDDTLARWLPQVPNADRITLRQILNHTSGMGDVWDDPGFVPRLIAAPARRWTAGDLLALMPDPTLAPGEGWSYSSSAYVALGHVLEAVSATPVADLLRTRLFVPLSLSRTFYAATDSATDPRAHAFLDVNNDGTAEDFTRMLPATAFLTAAGPSGAVVATPGDTARWLRALCTGGVVSHEGWREMTAWVERPDGNHHGLGVLRVELDGAVLYGHRGNSAGFSAAAWHAPEAGVTVAVLTNAHGVLVAPIVRALLAAARDD